MSEIKIQKGLPLHAPQVNPDAKIRQAAQMYEQHFLGEMVKAMRQTVEHGQLTEPTMAEKIYSEQLDGHYVESWAGRGGVGLADIIYNQVQDRFFNHGGVAPRPQGPLHLQKGTTIKIDETRQHGIPVVTPRSTIPNNDVSFLYEWNDADQNSRPHEVLSPYDGELLQSFRVGEDRQILKIAHNDGLLSTLSFMGQTKDLRLGDRVTAGQKLGALSPLAKGLTWQVGRVGT